MITPTPLITSDEQTTATRSPPRLYGFTGSIVEGTGSRGTTWHEELEAMLVEDDADGADEEALERESEDGVEGPAD